LLKMLETKKAMPRVPQLFQSMERLHSTNTDSASRNAAQLVNIDPLQIMCESDAATAPPTDAQHRLPRCPMNWKRPSLYRKWQICERLFQFMGHLGKLVHQSKG
jgi:hypothetical protein